MAKLNAVRYYGFADASGYGQACIAYVRALVNAGIAVQWIPLDWTPTSPIADWAAKSRPLLELCGGDGHLADLPALVERTAAPAAHDIVVAHAPPEFWPACFERGRRNIGYAAWETDRLPAHWPPLLHAAHRVLVPCCHNAAAFRAAGIDPLIVPHVRRHRWHEHSPSQLAAARADLGIPAGDIVFYTIGSWEPRKAMAELIDAFTRAFGADDAVTLLIKTTRTGYGAPPRYLQRATQELATEAITAAVARGGRPPPRIVLHDRPLDGDAIDAIHAVGDVYVSLSHGEGWGLGAFEAAALAKPVVMAAWGGQTDFLGDDWPGALPHRLVPAPVWPPDQPSCFPSQRWAEVDVADAAATLRALLADLGPARAAARATRERLTRDFAEPVVVNRLIEALA